MTSQAPRRLFGREAWTANSLGLVPDGSLEWLQSFGDVKQSLISWRPCHTCSWVAMLPMSCQSRAVLRHNSSVWPWTVYLVVQKPEVGLTDKVYECLMHMRPAERFSDAMLPQREGSTMPRPQATRRFCYHTIHQRLHEPFPQRTKRYTYTCDP